MELSTKAEMLWGRKTIFARVRVRGLGLGLVHKVIPNATKATGLVFLSYAGSNHHEVIHKNRKFMGEKKLFARVRVQGFGLRLEHEVIPNAINVTGLVFFCLMLSLISTSC
jgi:hypothetical protein